MQGIPICLCPKIIFPFIVSLVWFLVNLIIFCVFLEVNFTIFKKKLSFPVNMMGFLCNWVNKVKILVFLLFYILKPVSDLISTHYSHLATCIFAFKKHSRGWRTFRLWPARPSCCLEQVQSSFWASVFSYQKWGAGPDNLKFCQAPNGMFYDYFSTFKIFQSLHLCPPC